MSRILKSTLSAAGAAALLLTGAAAANAHVSVSPDKTSANSNALLSFNIPHGCDGSGTTKVTITLPEELDDATPTVNPNWTISKVTEKLASPKKLATGNSITSRTKAIVYTAKAPLDAHQRDALVLAVKLPDTPEKTLHFPTLQQCTSGSSDWKEIPQAGQDEESVKLPAPSFTLTAATTQGGHDSHGAPAPEASHGAVEAAAATDSAASATDGTALRSWLGLGAGLLGLILGGAALLRTVRKSR